MNGKEWGSERGGREENRRKGERNDGAPPETEAYQKTEITDIDTFFSTPSL